MKLITKKQEAQRNRKVKRLEEEIEYLESKFKSIKKSVEYFRGFIEGQVKQLEMSNLRMMRKLDTEVLSIEVSFALHKKKLGKEVKQ